LASRLAASTALGEGAESDTIKSLNRRRAAPMRHDTAAVHGAGTRGEGIRYAGSAASSSAAMADMAAGNTGGMALDEIAEPAPSSITACA
jgi:hypothetical protein